MSIGIVQTARCGAAKAMCAKLNGGYCRCRDTASLGTCSKMVDVFDIAIKTFFAHPQMRTMENETANMATVTLYEELFVKDH